MVQKLLGILIIFLSCSVLFATPEDDISITQEFEKTASEMQYFCTRDFLYDRGCGRDCSSCDKTVDDELLKNLLSNNVPPAILLKLLVHENPKVRTLGIAGLYASGDVQMLPYIATMVTDSSPTFELPQPCNCPAKQQTVGDVANAILKFYLDGSSEREFRTYWKERKDRNYCAGWYSVALLRATSGVSPIREDKIPKIRRLRLEIDQLPLPDRVWILLRLWQPDFEPLVTEHELVDLCLQVGADQLMTLLKGERISEDPDLQVSGYERNAMSMFVLQHASLLLRSKDALDLLSRQRDLESPWWIIAASELQPERAKLWLHNAFRNFPKESDYSERATISGALWRIVGESQIDFLVDWLYEEKRTCRSGDNKHPFFSVISKRPISEQKKLVAAIIQDPRFDQLDWMSLRHLIDMVNGWSSTPLLDPSHYEDAIRDMYGDFECVHEEWRKTGIIPSDDKKLFDELANWRNILRKSESYLQ